MSYCRWSSDDFTSDVYVYEDVAGGWTTHVAGNHVAWKEGALDGLPSEDENWYERQRILMGMLGNIFADETEHYRREDVDHADAGETFNDPTAGECADRLERLKADGLNVPQYAIDSLRREQG